MLIGWWGMCVNRSPDPEKGARASMGGWGLGLGREEKPTEEDDEDETLDWDQAQVSCRSGRQLKKFF